MWQITALCPGLLFPSAVPHQFYTVLSIRCSLYPVTPIFSPVSSWDAAVALTTVSHRGAMRSPGLTPLPWQRGSASVTASWRSRCRWRQRRSSGKDSARRCSVRGDEQTGRQEKLSPRNSSQSCAATSVNTALEYASGRGENLSALTRPVFADAERSFRMQDRCFFTIIYSAFLFVLRPSFNSAVWPQKSLLCYSLLLFQARLKHGDIQIAR